ncbi:MAG: cytochrome c [Gemmatimonadaceae bacterium]
MSRWIRRLAYVLGTLVLLVAILAGFVSMKSSSMMTKKYNPPNEPITVVSDSTTLARGGHLVNVIGKCVECHETDLGGKVFIDDPAFARIVASNLTTGKGGYGSTYTNAEMAVAIRHGIRRDSTTALLMPSDDFQVLSDDDVAAVIAYIRSMPPVDRELPLTELHPVGKALSAAGQLPIFMAENIAIDRKHDAIAIRDTSVAYGRYLANAGGCTGCHGKTLSGGKIPGTPPEWPPAANITPTGISHYSDAELETILRTGKRPDGTAVNDVMPWRYTAKLTDEELMTTIKYLRTVPAKSFGGR